MHMVAEVRTGGAREATRVAGDGVRGSKGISLGACTLVALSGIGVVGKGGGEETLPETPLRTLELSATCWMRLFQGGALKNMWLTVLQISCGTELTSDCWRLMR